MGVKGLWQVLKELDCAAECPYEGLRGQIIAVDVSIWLYHFLKVHPERQDLVIAGLFGRIGRLVAWGVKPVFVFDGGVPELKRRVMSERRSGRDRGEREYQRLARRILKNKLLLSDASKEETDARPRNTDTANTIAPPIDWISQLEELSDFESSSEEDYLVDVGEIDIYSPEFRKLPFALQEQAILGTRKRARVELETPVATGIKSNEPPTDALEFSKAQVEALVKRHQLMQDLESLRGGKRQLLVQPDKKEILEVGRVAGRADSKYLFVKSAEGAGWTLSLGAEHNVPEPVEAVKKEETDDEEFLAMMFGEEGEQEAEEKSESRVKDSLEKVVDVVQEKEIIALDVEKDIAVVEEAVDRTNQETISDDRDTIVDEKDTTPSQHDTVPRQNDTIPPQHDTITLQDYTVQKDNFLPKDFASESSDSEFNLDIRPKRLPEYVLDGLLEKKSDYSVLESSQSTPPLQSHDQTYSQLIDAIRSEMKDLDAERLAALTAAASPSKALLDAFMELIHLFGLPFVVAPFEAEAQCAAIEGIDGVLSEDSDCFLFGAGVVYRGFFSGSKKACLTRFDCKLSRELLVVLACLLGCDYCEGVAGMGPKRAVELAKLLQNSNCTENFVDHIRREISTNPQHKFHKLCPADAFDERVFGAFLRPNVRLLRVSDLEWRAVRGEQLEAFMLKYAKWPAERTRQHLKDLQKRGA